MPGFCDYHSCFVFEKSPVRIQAILTEGLSIYSGCLQTNVRMCILKLAMTVSFHLFTIFTCSTLPSTVVR
jgi:hypothetical protein